MDPLSSTSVLSTFSMEDCFNYISEHLDVYQCVFFSICESSAFSKLALRTRLFGERRNPSPLAKTFICPCRWSFLMTDSGDISSIKNCAAACYKVSIEFQFGASLQLQLTQTVDSIVGIQSIYHFGTKMDAYMYNTYVRLMRKRQLGYMHQSEVQRVAVFQPN